jgi:hypothetical protein
VLLELPAGLDGHRRRIRRGGYPSRKAALEVLARLRSPRPGDGMGGVLTVGDWLAHWLVSRTSQAASTVRGYAAHIRLYLDPYLGRVLLAELTTGQVQAMFTAIIRQHHALGTPVSAATLTRIRATLRAALNAAIRRGLIGENPAAKAELPRARRPRAVVWTRYRVEQWRKTGGAAAGGGVDRAAHLKVVQDMLGHSSIVLTADTYTSVLRDAAYAAAEKVADLIIKAGCLVPGTNRRRRRQARRRSRTGTHAGRGQPTSAGRSRAHPARQIGRPDRRRRTRLR